MDEQTENQSLKIVIALEEGLGNEYNITIYRYIFL